jgi:hypothetical protein
MTNVAINKNNKSLACMAPPSKVTQGVQSAVARVPDSWGRIAGELLRELGVINHDKEGVR